MADEGEKSCPLCAEEMDVTDQQLKPCKCGYEICVWCWHHIMDMAEKDDTGGRCPACRTPYDKEKIVGMAASCERLVAEINSDRKLKSQKTKSKPHDGKKHLSSVRVIQRNLVYINGLPMSVADEDALQRRDYFSQYGKVMKVSISRTAGGAIQQSPNNTFSVYITYSKEDEAVRCIQSVHGFTLEGKPLRACFGTTKYCHAWLRNTHCSNPDCLYLHDVGREEDSFTKDEIDTAFTRSRVQQITGATYNMQRRSGSVLPPPVDDFISAGTASAVKPVAKVPVNNPVNQMLGSPPKDISGRSAALPAGASWGLRASNGCPPASNAACVNGPTKENSEPYNGSLDTHSVVIGTTQDSTARIDAKVKSLATEESRETRESDTEWTWESSKQDNAIDSQIPIPNFSKKVVQDAVPTDTTSSSLPPTVTNSSDLSRQSSSPSDVVENVGVNKKAQSLCSGLSSLTIDSHLDTERSDVTRSSSLVPNHMLFNSQENHGLQQPNQEQVRDLIPPSSNIPVVSDGVFDLRESSSWGLGSHSLLLPGKCSKLENDLLPLGAQRLNVVDSSVSNHSSSRLWQHGNACDTSNLASGDFRILHRKLDEPLVQLTSSDSLFSNGYNEKEIRSSAHLEKSYQQSNLFVNGEKDAYLGRLGHNGVSTFQKDSTLDLGESSIISNILSMDFDTWDESLASPHNLAKLLSKGDTDHGSLKSSNSWKVQNNNQSRFSFARQEDYVNQGTEFEPSLNSNGHMKKKCYNPQDYSERMDLYSDMYRNGVQSNFFDDSDTFLRNSSIMQSDKLSVCFIIAAKAQVSAPPGFSVPSRAPPPGFSFQERMDQAFHISGNNLHEHSSLLRNQYQVQANRNHGSIDDVELIDPAILAVGRGTLPNGINSSGLDMRSSFTPQHSLSETDIRLQLLMQQNISTHQNSRYSDISAHQNSRYSDISAHQNSRYSDHIGERFSSLGNTYNSRQLEQSPYLQVPFQSRNSRIPNGWDSWNEIQGGGTDLGMAELLRNERLGFNKYFPGSYDELKFQMPSSGYNRAFGM
ncbi:hypothetical protein GIB67_002238 [Kingdonia uniflora]|uniref:CCR4-NOT transcription complex subunit 4 n=1 Tax=Kingdonia uniflora TaxID=39325 RepID=A0A7J7KWW7_9MAGN|nr:hypothetical protein GIB67_002238 [Kingdonia uniflora]